MIEVDKVTTKEARRVDDEKIHSTHAEAALPDLGPPLHIPRLRFYHRRVHGNWTYDPRRDRPHRGVLRQRAAPQPDSLGLRAEQLREPPRPLRPSPHAG